MNNQLESFLGAYILVMLGATGLAMAAAVWLALWMLGPINKAAGALRAQTRFQLSDVLGLMVLLQIALGIVGTGFDAAAQDRLYWTMLAVLVLLATVLWGASVAAVSRAGINQPLRRLTVMIVLVPGTLAALMLLPGMVVALGAVFISRYDTTAARLPFGLAAICAAACGLAVGVIVIRRLSFWAILGPAPKDLAPVSHVA